MELASTLNLPYREAQNRYVGRTFIMPGQAVRKKSVRRNLFALPEEFKGKSCCWWMTPSCVVPPQADCGDGSFRQPAAWSSPPLPPPFATPTYAANMPTRRAGGR